LTISQEWIVEGPIVISTSLWGAGHYVVIRGVDEQGSFIVNDAFGDPRQAGYRAGTHIQGQGEGAVLDYGSLYSGETFFVNTGVLLIRPIEDFVLHNGKIYSASEIVSLPRPIEDFLISKGGVFPVWVDAFSVNDRVIEANISSSFFEVEGDRPWTYHYQHSATLPGGYLSMETHDGQTPINTARWTSHLRESGRYEIYAGFMAGPNNSKQVNYKVVIGVSDYIRSATVPCSQHSDGAEYKEVYLGTYWMDKDGNNYIEVTDNTGESHGEKIHVDVVKFKFWQHQPK